MEKLNKLELTDKQLSLVQSALDFYSRVGCGQFQVITEHPTFKRFLNNNVIKKKGEVIVGDDTRRGKVVEIDKKKKWWKTEGQWGGKTEVKKWTDMENLKHSPDYSAIHKIEDTAIDSLTHARNILTQDSSIGRNGNWGIYNDNVDDTCRMAFDLVQVIRHERWKADEDGSSITVDSHIHFTHRKDNSSNQIKCELK